MEKDKKITRKEFLGMALSVGAMLSLGFIARETEGQVEWIRPPGKAAREDFMALCLKCRKCIEVCPTSVIQPGRLQDGLLTYGTPILDFDRGYCNFCQECIDVCPTGALDKEAFSLSPKLGIAQINPDACIAWYWYGCGLCATKCPEEAIVLDAKKRPVVIEDKCTGCGLCEFVCPRPMLRSYDTSNGKGISVKPV